MLRIPAFWKPSESQSALRIRSAYKSPASRRAEFVVLQRSVTNPFGLAIRHRPEPFVPALPALEAAHVLRAPGLQELGTLPLPRPPIVVIACMACLDPEEVVCQLEIHTPVYALPDKPVDNAMST